MKIVLLSGGSGKRLWPLSNDVRSKQFIKLFKGEDGKYESMVQRVYRQICNVDPDADITIATSESQIASIYNQLGENIDICVEPCRRDTFPAIVLAASYLSDVKKISKEEAIIVCPVDPYVEEDFFGEIRELGKLVEDGETNLALLGIEPTYPSAKYGYIIPESDQRITRVKNFKEKPSEEIAEKYIKQGALWNGGVFAFRLEYLLNKAHEMIEFTDYYDLYEKYGQLNGISFDYAVVEKEKKIKVLRFSGEWKDIGTWNTLTESMDEVSVGESIQDDTCKNVYVVNELDMPILCMGLTDVIISASPEGILVTDKEQSSCIKPYVDKLNCQIMFAEKLWGSFKVLDVEKESMTIKVTLKPGRRMNYHSHERRDEIWNVIRGKGRVIVDGMEHLVKTGDVVTMARGCRHTVIAEEELQMIEVQIGKDITIHDKKKFELEYELHG